MRAMEIFLSTYFSNFRAVLAGVPECWMLMLLIAPVSGKTNLSKFFLNFPTNKFSRSLALGCIPLSINHLNVHGL